MMNLTRRDFLKGGAITALALAVGVKPKAPETTVTGIGRGSPRIFDNLGITITPEMMEIARAADAIKPRSCYDDFIAAIQRSVRWESEHLWPSPWTISIPEAYQEYAEAHGHPSVTDDERREAFLVATLDRLDAT